MNTRKNRIVAFTLLIIVALAMAWGMLAESAKAATIKEYESQIETNNETNQKLEEIKEHLHIVAELLREVDCVNNEFDALLSEKWHECNNYQVIKDNENLELQNKINELKNNKTLVGNFKITHYCPCKKCNGSWNNKTAMGTTVTPYKTIATDPKVIPLGSFVEINGEVYVAEDTGSAIKGNKIDLCVSSHTEAYNKGVLHNVPVYIVS